MYLSGSGDVGSVREINGTNIEPMVAENAFSYTCWQSVGNMAAYVVPRDSCGRTGKSRITYTLFYNQAVLASDAQRGSEHERLANRFQDALDSMKAAAESR
jgi:hypothetical protein